jgi:gluconate 2-dehydrogenase subunit 3-like protein
MPDSRPGTRFPAYDVLSKRQGLSWNDKTREVIARRLSTGSEPKFFTADEFLTVVAAADRIVPQPPTRSAIPVATLVDLKLHLAQSDGYRLPGTPRDGDAWRLGLKAVNAESRAAFDAPFHILMEADQDLLLARMQNGELRGPAWTDMTSDVFFTTRLAKDIVFAYYAHPTAWSEIGWGGPASPRGYVRMDYDERDPWEAAEVRDGDIEAARRKNKRVR